MTLLAIDIGTTHCKAGLFTSNGVALKIASRPTVTHKSPGGWSYFDPAEILQIVAAVVHEALLGYQAPIAAIGIASMAESGLLVDRRTGTPRSFFIPWFETVSQPQADRILQASDPLESYKRFGLRVTFKSSLAKLLWLSESNPSIADDAIWLSAADYLLYHLTGAWGSDYSLASRTLAFRVDRKCWDEDWLRAWGFAPDLFPPAYAGGDWMGTTRGAVFDLPAGIPVSVCGHDHVCAALAVGAVEPGVVFDSMGTAEALIGALPERPLTETDFRIGLQYGCHVARRRSYWMGGLSTSGGSVEWLRSLAGKSHLTYEELDALLQSAPPDPTGILYFPYLLGSGSPHSDPRLRAAFVGLEASHEGAAFFKAVLEGVAYEIEFIRRAGEQMAGQPIPTLIVAGGGTRYRPWLQIKADVSGCPIQVSAESEATLLGAALAAGIGNGVYHDEAQALAAIEARPAETFYPDPVRHQVYQSLFEDGYLAFQEPLRNYYSLRR